MNSSRPNPVDIPYYKDFISEAFRQYLFKEGAEVSEVSGLVEIGKGGGLENSKSLQFLVDLYEKVRGELGSVLEQRIKDRAFIDQKTKACFGFNQFAKRDFLDPAYKTILGLQDGEGRTVIGPKRKDYYKNHGQKVAELPDYLKGYHVTLFGPPGNAKLSINAMNAYHRKLKDEPRVITELLEFNQSLPKWGADDEDSKTPLRSDLVVAGANLTKCFNGTITVENPGNDKRYQLQKENLSVPIKRFPGLALPCSFLFYNGSPIPLHLYDFALHLFENWENPKSLTFYVPKLETEEEARYVKNMIAAAEDMIHQLHPEYQLGTVRLLIVLENPRAVFRLNEIMDELYPYFAGASLGWHDYLGSTARLLKEDPNYRIPVKADPNIVIKHIKGSHQLLADVVGPRGGIKIGGMYGVLPTVSDISSSSFQVSIVGFIKDVVTQMKRGLDGFWVAHPDFVRIGLAIVEAWNQHSHGKKEKLEELVKALVNPKNQDEVLSFISGPDIGGLDYEDPLYDRALIVADIKESNFIPNNHPDEIRYNVFQSLQYLTDWLNGNGCVALPAQIGYEPIRMMDDLATLERSRWEVWHEIYHGRFSVEDFLKIAHEEMHFIRKDFSSEKKVVQVKWNAMTEKWYPIAFRLMVQLMTAKKPVEFVTELLMPFTIESIRKCENPWHLVTQIDSKKYRLDSYVDRFSYFFERCGVVRFAKYLAGHVATDMDRINQLIMGFDQKEIRESASFHGDIGENKKGLDSMAREEQSKVDSNNQELNSQLMSLGAEYKTKFAMKFLISAKGKSGEEMLEALRGRMNNSLDQELDNARKALFEITKSRILSEPIDGLLDKVNQSLAQYKIMGASVALSGPTGDIQSLNFGVLSKDHRPVTSQSRFELASLSKSVATAFALEFFKQRDISLSAQVNSLLEECGSTFRLKSGKGLPESWADQVRLCHLMNHSGLNLHYVNGVSVYETLPPVEDLLNGYVQLGYEPVEVVSEPGTAFQYSGGGFLVLQHLIEKITGQRVPELTRSFLNKLGMREFSFDPQNLPSVEYAHGYKDSGEEIEGTRKMFPSFAAGAMGTSQAVLAFLRHLTSAYHRTQGSGPISHDTAVMMLHGRDKGCREFMGVDMGMGIFTAEAGPNRLALHQGANDGFRGLFVHCFDGPDRGRGMVLLANGEENGVLFISKVAQFIFREFAMEGVDLRAFKSEFLNNGISQEKRVNQGYKNLVFGAFEPTLPEKINPVGELDPLSSYNLVVGAQAVSVTNQRFGRAENLLSPYLPVYDPQLFGLQGKIMDSWETVRHNEFDRDLFHFRLEKPRRIKYAYLSTQFHLGNHAPNIQLEGYAEDLDQWEEILPITPLEGHCHKSLQLENGSAYQDIRVSLYPDGGFTRLGLFGDDLPENYRTRFEPVSMAKSIPFEHKVPQTTRPMHIDFNIEPDQVNHNLSDLLAGEEFDAASAFYGAKVADVTNEHYGPAKQVISPYPPMSMFDGLESARSRKADHSEQVTIQFWKKCPIHKLDLDFTYFVNNNPNEVEVFGSNEGSWELLCPRLSVKGYAGQIKSIEFDRPAYVDTIKVVTYPDGGINRIRAYSKKE